MINKETLETKRLYLRPLTIVDFNAVHSWASNPENVKYMAWGPNTEGETKEFLLSVNPGRDFAVVLKESCAVIGSCGVYPDAANDSGFLGWILHMDYWKQGYGTELAGELIRYGFEDLKLRRLFAPCAAVNYGSYRIMERNGMRREALHKKAFWARVDKEWIDEAVYAILAEEYFNAERGNYATERDSCVAEGDSFAIKQDNVAVERDSSVAERASFAVEQISEQTRDIATAYIIKEWQTAKIKIRGEVIDCSAIDGFIILDESREKAIGLITYIFRGEACEIVSLNSERPCAGIGTALVEKVKAAAIAYGCKTLRLLTSNDNLNAIGFYQKRGFDLVGVNFGAIDRARETFKPEIPLIGQNGIPLRHELDFSMKL